MNTDMSMNALIDSAAISSVEEQQKIIDDARPKPNGKSHDNPFIAGTNISRTWYGRVLRREARSFGKNAAEVTEEKAKYDLLSLSAVKLGQVAKISKLTVKHVKGKLTTAAIGAGLPKRCIKKIDAVIEEGFAKGVAKKMTSPYWMDRNSKGAPDAASKFNVESYLAWAGIHMRLNIFSHKIEIHGRGNKTIEITDKEDISIWDDCHTHGMRISREFLYNSLNALAMRDQYHPVRDYFNGLKWDGVARLDTMLVDYFGAADNEYTRCVTSKTFIAGVRRIYQPGTKFDQMPILEDYQGTGKSETIEEVISPRKDWYTSSINFAMDEKVIIEKTFNKLVVEMADMQLFSKADINKTKGFMSSSTDRARLAYDKRTSDVPRQFIMIGTINIKDNQKCEYLKDPTGNRRFWPVRCGGRVKQAELVR
jgi:hypothetical protein